MTAASTRLRPAPKSGSTPLGKRLLGEPRLWREVVYQGLFDAFMGRGRHRRNAIRWLSSNDFIHVCDLSQVNPARVMELAEKLWTMSKEEQTNLLRQLRVHLERKE